VCHGGFGCAVGEAGSELAAETGDRRRDDDLRVLRKISLSVAGVEKV
jgi:hypothetical protein